MRYRYQTATFFREVAINFSIKTHGVFDVVTPVLEDDEMFNSGLLKEQVGRMFASGRRHIALDISPLDYIYSDGINALITLNKQAQDSGGTLALLSPQAKVVGILQTAGIQSSMSVLSGEAELTALSSRLSAAAVAAGSAAQSEFESLRSEIGTAFGDEAPLSEHASAPPPLPTPPPLPPPPPPPDFETFSAPAPMEPQPMSPPPVPPATTALQPETTVFGELGAPPPKNTAFDSLDDSFGKKKKKIKDPFDDDDDDFGKKKKKVKDPFDDNDDFGGKKKKADPFDDDDFGADDDNVFKTKKKGSPVAAIAAVLVLMALAGGGYYYFGVMGGKIGDFGGGDSQAPAVTPPADVPGSPAESPVTSAAPPDIPVTTIEVETPKPMPFAQGGKQKDSKPDTKQKSSSQSQASAPKTSYSTPSYSAPEPAYSPPAADYSPPPPPPEPEPAPPPPPPKVEQVVVTSNPSGATVEVDGKRAGVTPYTFKPASWGDITIAITMNGYEKAVKTVEFEGGTLNVPFTLSRAAAAAPPAAAPPPAARPPAGASIFIATLPPKAEVYVGGKLVGTSNEGELQVPTGTHEVRFVKDGVEKTETITFNPGKNPTKFVNLKQ